MWGRGAGLFRELLTLAALACCATPALAQNPLAPTTGTINNLVVFIRFSDQPEFTQSSAYYDGLFNTASNSLKNFYLENSYNALTVNSTFYPAPSGNAIVSYQDAHPASYYEAYNASTNPGGYQGTQSTTREAALISNALAAISAQIPAGLNLDGDDDGYIDHITFEVYSSSAKPLPVLFYSRATYDTTGSVTLKGKQVGSYVWVAASQDSPTTGFSLGATEIHEMGHSFGYPDLRSNNSRQPVGDWDVMANATRVVHSGAWMKYKFTNWITNIPEITAYGNYTLNNLTLPANNAYKLALPNSSEFLILEYRKAAGTFEQNLFGSGLCVTRVNEAQGMWGNLDGAPWYLYYFRKDGTTTADGVGNAWQGCLSVEAGRREFTDTSNPACFVADGSACGISITNVGSSAGASISFTVAAPGSVSDPPPVTGNNPQNPPAQASSATSLTTSSGFSESGQAVIFTAIVTGSTPSGLVNFTANGAALCSNVALANGRAQCVTSTLAVGTHSVSATYPGDTNNTSSVSGSVTLNVSQVSAPMNPATPSEPSMPSEPSTPSGPSTPANPPSSPTPETPASPNASFTASAPGSTLMIPGTSNILLVAGSTGASLDVLTDSGSGLRTVTVKTGSVTLPQGTFASGVVHGNVYAGEIVMLDGTGALINARLDFAPLPATAPANVTLNAVIPDLNQPVARLAGATALGNFGNIVGERAGLTFTAVTQNAHGVVEFRFSGGKVMALPVGDVLIDATRSDSLVTSELGLLMQSQGLVTMLVPSVADFSDFANRLSAAATGSTASIGSDGTILATLRGNTYAVQPGWLARPGNGTPGFSGQADGYIHYTDGSGFEQILYPAFADLTQLTARYRTLDPSFVVFAQGNGRFSATLNGKVYSLVPDYVLVAVPPMHANDAWWQEADGKVFMRYSSGKAQGFRFF